MTSVLRRLARVRILSPLRHRDFALRTAGSTVSLFGDGFMYVALAWQVYEISNVPTAMSVVGVAATIPLVVFLLVGGVLSDRYDPRRVMVLADLLRALAIGAIGFLSITGVLQLWHVVALITIVGVGDALFNPASTAIVPNLVPTAELPQANALASLVRPLMLRIAGPAVGGLAVHALGPGPAFVVDAASFVISAAFVGLIAPLARDPRAAAAGGLRRTLADVGEGLAFVRANPWCWATLLAAMVAMLAFYGPVEVLLPYLVKNRLELGADALGLIFVASGLGSMVAALAIGQFSVPRRRITTMYLAWTIGSAALAGYGVMTALWQPMVVAAISGATFMLGQVVWTSLLQELVPRELLGRVSSVDWLVSVGLVPVSFALTGPISGWIGPTPTMVGGALVAATATIALLFVPGVRDPERNATVPVGGHLPSSPLPVPHDEPGALGPPRLEG
jgi:MFS family permease